MYDYKRNNNIVIIIIVMMMMNYDRFVSTDFFLFFSKTSLFSISLGYPIKINLVVSPKIENIY